MDSLGGCDDKAASDAMQSNYDYGEGVGAVPGLRRRVPSVHVAVEEAAS